MAVVCRCRYRARGRGPYAHWVQARAKLGEILVILCSASGLAVTPAVIVTLNNPHTPNAAGPAGSYRIMDLSAEELLSHSEWLRRFAAALVRDRQDADDLAQDALVALAATDSEVRDVRGFLACLLYTSPSPRDS